jgi:hypothetical protein
MLSLLGAEICSPSPMMLNLLQILAPAPCQDVRFGSKADVCGAKRHVRFTPNSDRKSGHVTMSFEAASSPQKRRSAKSE